MVYIYIYYYIYSISVGFGRHLLAEFHECLGSLEVNLKRVKFHQILAQLFVEKSTDLGLVEWADRFVKT